MCTSGRRRYVDQFAHALAVAAALPAPVVIAGDLNAQGGESADGRAHLRNVEAAAAAGWRSAYHHHVGVAHGSEPAATYRHYGRPERAFHIDFIFLPDGWCPAIRAVEVREDAFALSDHAALVVDVEPPSLRAPAAP